MAWNAKYTPNIVDNLASDGPLIIVCITAPNRAKKLSKQNTMQSKF